MGKRSLKVAGLSIRASVSVDLIAHFSVDLARPFHIIASKEIKLPIIVIIKPCRACAPGLGQSTYASFPSHFAKLARTFIAEQMIAADCGDEDIRQSVIVIVTHGNAHAIKTQ